MTHFTYLTNVIFFRHFNFNVILANVIDLPTIGCTGTESVKIEKKNLVRCIFFKKENVGGGGGGWVGAWR